MQSNKVMTKLAIYVFMFTMIVCLIGGLMVYVFSNIRKINNETIANSDYSVLNLYFLKTVQTDNITLKNYGLVDNEDISSYFITFEKEDGTTNTFIKIGNIIYFNKIKICENVDEFKVIVDKSGKGSISIEVKMLDKVYNSQYALK